MLMHSARCLTLLMLPAAGEAGTRPPAAEAVPEPAGDGVGGQQGAPHAFCPSYQSDKAAANCHLPVCPLLLDARQLEARTVATASLVKEVCSRIQSVASTLALRASLIVDVMVVCDPSEAPQCCTSAALPAARPEAGPAVQAAEDALLRR